MKAVGYLRVSTQEQAQSGLGLGAQREKIRLAAELREWKVTAWYTDEGVSGTVPPWKRAGMLEALRALDAGEADALIVAKLDRASRSAGDFASLMKLAQEQGWELVLIDVGVDTTTPAGRFVAQVMAAAAELERDLIAERTRDALAVLKAQGFRLGRPVQLPDKVRRRIVRERSQGRSLQSIADRLTAAGIETAHGGRWHHSTVAAVLASVELDQERPAA